MQRTIKNREDLNALVAQFQAQGGTITRTKPRKARGITISKGTKAVTEAIRKAQDQARESGNA